MTKREAVGQEGAGAVTARPSVLDLALGSTVGMAGAAHRVATPALRTSLSLARLVLRAPPLHLDRKADRWLDGLGCRGQRWRSEAETRLAAVLDRLVPLVAAGILDRLDLTGVVRDRVDLDSLVALVDTDAIVSKLDLDAIVARVDVDAIVARVSIDSVLDRIDLTRVVQERVDVDTVVRGVDIDAVIDRVDLVTRANMIIDAIDLPEIIRESTGSVASETVRGVRLRGVAADDVVRRAADRLLPRRNRSDHDRDMQLPGLDGPSLNGHPRIRELPASGSRDEEPP